MHHNQGMLAVTAPLGLGVGEGACEMHGHRQGSSGNSSGGVGRNRLVSCEAEQRENLQNGKKMA